ncbi:Putative prophage phiRv2 integrase [Nocardioides aquaticus]|uniref:Prophage phiRv2 integrase n=2 Tax=Actinomycetes TaxID=1760 RepID=A0ABX8EKY3_9ACTN|nr:tyrosine-type recombinase/integrase [Nocardioides aquaticus]QVT81194.1 Putative prophage phiRv2 integrase [Nocardioides aquaticus]
MNRERAQTRHLHIAHGATVQDITVDDVGEETVETYLENWLWGKQSLRPSTHTSYEIHIRRYLVPYLGNLPLTALRPLHVERMYRELAMLEGTRGRPITVSTLRRVHATLMSAMNTAVRRGLIERNPAATVELPRTPRPTMNAWTAEELGRFLTLTTADPMNMMFVLLGLVGLRRGEAVALRWSDLDLNAGLLRVEQTSVRVGGRTVIGPPKSSSGQRVVAIDEETARRLQWHQCRQRLSVLRASDERVPPPTQVFTTERGEPLDPAYVSRLFSRLIAHHNLRPIRLHDLRHTSASVGLASGESLVEVSRRLGHSSITITADVYSHVSPEVAKSSAERLARTIYHP